jgi:hypothetical protein
MGKIFFILIVVFLSSCELPNQPELKKVEGYISMVGNMPFTNLAVVTNKEIYILQCSEQIEKIFYNTQGCFYRIFYVKKYKSSSDNIIVVTYFEKLK